MSSGILSVFMGGKEGGVWLFSVSPKGWDLQESSRALREGLRPKQGSLGGLWGPGEGWSGCVPFLYAGD